MERRRCRDYVISGLIDKDVLKIVKEQLSNKDYSFKNDSNPDYSIITYFNKEIALAFKAKTSFSSQEGLSFEARLSFDSKTVSENYALWQEKISGAPEQAYVLNWKIDKDSFNENIIILRGKIRCDLTIAKMAAKMLSELLDDPKQYLNSLNFL